MSERQGSGERVALWAIVAWAAFELLRCALWDGWSLAASGVWP